jgi:hypothetical protein
MSDSETSHPVLPDGYVREVGRLAYFWAWPMVNLRNRFEALWQVPEPGLMGGVMPVGPHNQIGMLRDYITPDQKYVACPNQDVVYGFGILHPAAEPAVVQVPDFGSRFWVYQLGDQRTDGFAQLGSMYGSAPGCYLVASADWDGDVPEGIEDVFRCPTSIGYAIPRVFMDDTSDDRAAIQPLVNQVMVYPLGEFTGELRTRDWSAAPSFPAQATTGSGEIQWVRPEAYFDTLPAVLDDVPPLPGEEALYTWVRPVLDIAADDERVMRLLRDAAAEAERDLVAPLFDFRHVGVPLANGWTSPTDNARFGTDYLTRTACAKSNIFVNQPEETTYFYLETDADGETLDGANAYTVTFAAGQLPPVRGFWSLTLYNEHHFFHPNELGRYSLGTKNKDLVLEDEGSLTIHVQTDVPDAGHRANWLPAPAGRFELYLRAYWPEDAVLEGAWVPPAATRNG